MKKALKIKKDPFSAEDVGIFYGSYDSYEDYLKAGGEPYNRQTLEAINDTDEENFSGPYDSFDEFLEELYGKMQADNFLKKVGLDCEIDVADYKTEVKIIL